MDAFRKRQRALEKEQRLRQQAESGTRRKSKTERKKKDADHQESPSASEAVPPKRKRGASADPHPSPPKKTLKENQQETTTTLKAGPSHTSSQVSKSQTEYSWRDLLKDFEDLTVEKAASPWDSRLASRQFIGDSFDLDNITHSIRRLGMSDTCEALANHGLKVASLATSLAQVYKSQDAGRDRLEAEVAQLKASIAKAQDEASSSKKAQATAEAEKSQLEKKVIELQSEADDARAALTAEVKKKEAAIFEMQSLHQHEVEEMRAEITRLTADREILTGQAVEKYEEGFKYAKRQLHSLDPSFDLKKLGAYKRFVDGNWVGSDDSETEESESESDEEETLNHQGDFTAAANDSQAEGDSTQNQEQSSPGGGTSA